MPIYEYVCLNYKHQFDAIRPMSQADAPQACKKCGGIVAVEHAPLAKLYRQLESSTGYKLDSSHVTLFGLCPNCQP